MKQKRFKLFINAYRRLVSVCRGISLEQKRSILSIEAVPQTRLRYARGISLKQKRFKLLVKE